MHARRAPAWLAIGLTVAWSCVAGCRSEAVTSPRRSVAVEVAPGSSVQPAPEPIVPAFTPHPNIAGAVRVRMPSASQVAIGDGHACALARRGEAWCWRFGSHGFDDATYAREPTRLDGHARAAVLSAAGDRSCITDGSGAVVCWGSSVPGEPQPATRIDGAPRPIHAQLDAVHVSTGHEHACAITSAGLAFCWGDPSFGAVGAGSAVRGVVPGVDAVTRLAAGRFGTCAVSRATLVCWGAASLVGWAPSGARTPAPAPAPTPPTPLIGVNDVVDVSVSGRAPCLVRRSGSVMCWSPEDATTLLPINPLPARAVVRDLSDAIAVRGDLVLRASGTLAAIELPLDGSYAARPFEADALKHVVDADGSTQRGCAVGRAGQVICWRR